MDFNQSKAAYFDPIAFLADQFKEVSSPPGNPFGLLKLYGTKVKRLAVEEPEVQSSDFSRNEFSSSSLMILKSAKAHVHKMITKNVVDNESIMLLQAAAEKVATKNFACAKKLLIVCMQSGCKNGTTVQRIVYYFSESLRARIDLDMCQNQECYRKPQDVIQTHYSLEPAVIERPQEFKNIQDISQFAGIQAILDGVGLARRLHIIDLGIRNGSQWTILMQALSERKTHNIKHLRITAIGTSDEIMINTGKRLCSFAETLSLPFSFGIVISDLKDIKKDSFDLDSNETVAVYSSMCLFGLVAFPLHLESLVREIRSFKPRIMVVHELYANTNSLLFLERFEGALSYFSTIFDFLSILGTDHPYRKLMEGTYYRIMMRNILTTEGTKRIHRHENINFWQNLFIRCGFIETTMSSLALCQAKFLQNTLVDAYSSCSMNVDRKSLILGWKGNPMEFVSTWQLYHK